MRDPGPLRTLPITAARCHSASLRLFRFNRATFCHWFTAHAAAALLLYRGSSLDVAHGSQFYFHFIAGCDRWRIQHSFRSSWDFLGCLPLR